MFNAEYTGITFENDIDLDQVMVF